MKCHFVPLSREALDGLSIDPDRKHVGFDYELDALAPGRQGDFRGLVDRNVISFYLDMPTLDIEYGRSRVGTEAEVRQEMVR